jgi:hypothetical protein
MNFDAKQAGQFFLMLLGLACRHTKIKLFGLGPLSPSPLLAFA